ncbi:hypothetical protein GJ496_011443 [Pomphorhynchus laevis]|nr:hypothetical protein GJ496_011443 [Pomphorhynchus laevis]
MNQLNKVVDYEAFTGYILLTRTLQHIQFDLLLTCKTESSWFVHCRSLLFGKLLPRMLGMHIDDKEMEKILTLPNHHEGLGFWDITCTLTDEYINYVRICEPAIDGHYGEEL